MSIGVDIGTSFFVTAREAPNGIDYKQFRDAFYRIRPASAFAGAMLQKGLANMPYFKDVDGSFVVVGEDAISKAIERNSTVSRPLYRGVISPREPDARRVLKFILSQLVGRPVKDGESLVYSIPAEPVDQLDENFNTGYHEDCLKQDLGELGWNARSLNEAEAICYSELVNNDYTGICMSFGAGMVNVCVMSSGDPVIKYSTTKSGDWIDRMAAQSTGQSDSLVQVEKENTSFRVGEENKNPILSAVSSYYMRLIDYTIKYLATSLTNNKKLPRFRSSVPLIISGGTSLANGFIEAFRNRLSQEKLPIEISNIIPASDPLRVVAKGCMLSAALL